MKYSRKTTKLLLAINLFLFATLVSASLYQLFSLQTFGTIKAAGTLEDPLEAWSEANYIVWKYNSTFYAARNTSTNMVDFFGSNATQIINNVIKNNTSVVLKGGTTAYNISAKILVDNVQNFQLLGIGDPQLQSAVGFSDYTIEVRNAPTYSNIRISGLYIDGVDKTRGGGILLNASGWVEIDHCFVRDVEFEAIKSTGSGGSEGTNKIHDNWLIGSAQSLIYLETGADSHIKNNFIAYSPYDGIRVDTNRHQIYANHVWEVLDGIRSVGGSFLKIQDNILEKLTGSAVRLISSYKSDVLENQIAKEGAKAPAIGVELENSDDNAIALNHIWDATTYAIYGDSNSDNNTVKGNTISSPVKTINMTGKDNEVFGNKGYPTDLDMLQKSILNATFDMGTSFPSSPVAGQYFWRSDLDTLYVYNSTSQWQSMATGATGPAGPAGTVNGLPFSYYVFQNSTSNYLLNGTTGAIDGSTTNDAAILMWSINNLSAQGGRVIWGAGDYTVGTTILPTKSNYIVEGFGTSTNLTLADGVNGTIIRVGSWGGFTGYDNITFRDIYFNGNKDNNMHPQDSLQNNWTNAITFFNCHNVKVEDCFTVNFRRMGMAFASYRDTTEATNNWAIGNTVFDCGWNGIQFSYTSDSGAKDNYIKGWRDVATSSWECKGMTFTGNFAIDPVSDGLGYNDAGWGFTMECGTPNPIYDFSEDCIFDNNYVQNAAAGIVVMTNCTGPIISNNRIVNCSAGVQIHGDTGGADVGRRADFVIDGNSITNNSGLWGIEIYRGYGIVSNNHIQFIDPSDDYNAQIGINLAYSNNVSVFNNRIRESFVGSWAWGWHNGSITLYNSNSCRVIGNVIEKMTGDIAFGIYEAGPCVDNFYMANDVSGVANGIYANDKSITKDNIGYNPVGNIANPVSGTYLVDDGSGTIANNTEYTCWQSPKIIYISGGTVSVVQHNGQTVFTTTNVMVVLQPGDTVKIVWSDPPTITVMGQ